MSMLVNPFSSGGGAPPVTDPYFANVKLLAHFDGTNGSVSFPNSASGGSTISAGGLAVLTTVTPEYGSACLTTAGAGRAIAADSADYQIGTSDDFTLEFSFLTPTPSQSNKTLLDFNDTLAHATTGFEIYIDSSSYRFYFNGVDRITGGTVATTTWQKIAYSRASGTGGLYVAGTRVGTYSDSNTYNHGFIDLGSEHLATANVTGTFDEWRLTVGVGRYTGASYTPATAAFPDS